VALRFVTTQALMFTGGVPGPVQVMPAPAADTQPQVKHFAEGGPL
jgi:hypothetical protein